jgi:hypothetical protein
MPSRIELACGDARLEVWTQVDQMPPQPRYLACALGDHVRTVIGEQPDLQCTLALPTTGPAHHIRRDPDRALTRNDQFLLEPPREMTASLDRPHLFLIQPLRPSQRPEMHGPAGVFDLKR